MTTGLLRSRCQRALGYQHFYQHFASSGPHTGDGDKIPSIADSVHSSPFQANSREEVIAPVPRLWRSVSVSGFSGSRGSDSHNRLVGNTIGCRILPARQLVNRADLVCERRRKLTLGKCTSPDRTSDVVVSGSLYEFARSQRETKVV
jgi:hypothetical protein